MGRKADNARKILRINEHYVVTDEWFNGCLGIECTECYRHKEGQCAGLFWGEVKESLEAALAKYDARKAAKAKPALQPKVRGFIEQVASYFFEVGCLPGAYKNIVQGLGIRARELLAEIDKEAAK